MKHLFTPFITLQLLLLVLTTSSLHAQVRTKRSAQPQDLSALGIESGNKQATPTLSLSAIDAAPLLLEDEAEALLGKPFRFGLNRAVDVDIIQTAAQSEQNGTRTYSYQITADGAFSINLIFDRFQLKPGSKLYLYNSDRTMLIGPITDAQNPRSGGNPAGGAFWTDLVQGSTLLIDLQEPIAGSGTSELHLSSVVHAYKNLFPTTNKANGDAGTCHPNMVCYPDFQFEGDGVAMILVAPASRICTGSMVNDMRQSFRSFFLTANHCTGGDTDNWLIRFNYQSTTCPRPNDDDLDVVTLNGTTFRAKWSNSDFALFELTQQVPPDVNTTYNGWNRGAAMTSNNFGIHHPRGDVKKISFTNADTEVYGWGVPGTTHVTSFWSTSGVTDPGSSGSPLFDGNRRIVGQLHGGPSSCGATGSDLRDYYGRVFTSWTGGGTPSTRLSNWLDPDNTTSVSVTNGVKPLVSGPAAFTSASSFSLNTGTSSITAWTVTGGAGIVSPTSGTGNTANLMALSSGSNLTITFGVDAGQSYPIRFAKVFDATLSPSPTITTQPATASSVCAGASVVVTVGVSGSISGYQWLKNGSPVGGQTGPTLSLGNVQVSDGGMYSLSLTGPTGSTTSSNFTLTVNPVPVVTLTIPVGTTAQGSSGIALITLPANGFPTTFQASGGNSYERQIVLDQINGYAIRQVDQNTSGIFTINRTGLFTLTVTGAGGCSRTVQWIVQRQ